MTLWSIFQWHCFNFKLASALYKDVHILHQLKLPSQQSSHFNSHLSLSYFILKTCAIHSNCTCLYSRIWPISIVKQLYLFSLHYMWLHCVWYNLICMFFKVDHSIIHRRKLSCSFVMSLLRNAWRLFLWWLKLILELICHTYKSAKMQSCIASIVRLRSNLFLKQYY